MAWDPHLSALPYQLCAHGPSGEEEKYRGEEALGRGLPLPQHGVSSSVLKIDSPPDCVGHPCSYLHPSHGSVGFPK